MTNDLQQIITDTQTNNNTKTLEDLIKWRYRVEEERRQVNVKALAQVLPIPQAKASPKSLPAATSIEKPSATAAPSDKPSVNEAANVAMNSPESPSNKRQRPPEEELDDKNKKRKLDLLKSRYTKK